MGIDGRHSSGWVRLLVGFGGRARSLDAAEQETEGRKEADSAPILINGVFSAVADAGLRTAAPSLGPTVGISQELLGRLGAGLGQKGNRVECRRGRKESTPRRALAPDKRDNQAAWRAAAKAPRVHHHRALRPGPPSARAGQPYGRCFQVPQDAWSRRPRRPNATESRRIGRSAHQFFFFAGLALSIGHIGRALGPPKTKVTMPFAIPTAEMPGRRHAEPWGPFVCQQRRKEKKKVG